VNWYLSCVGRQLAVVAFAGTACMSPGTTNAASPASTASGTASRLAAAADAYFAPLAASGDFAGTVLVARGDRVLFEKGYGFANAEMRAPNTPETVFRVASLTKTFTAAAIAMLAERGTVKYTDSLSTYLPDFPAGNRIRIRDLLLHRSGVANPSYEEIVTSRLSLDDLVTHLAGKPLRFEPGTSVQYSNGGYVLLAAVIERASGVSYAEFLRRNISEPLGLQATMPDAQEAVIPARATGYVPGPPPVGLENVMWYDMSAMAGSGSLVTTARDLHRWARAVQRETLHRRATLPYPFGWGVRKYFGRDLLEQSGSLDGFTSYLGVYFTDSTYVICLTNIEAGLNDRCGKDLAAMAFGERYAPVAPFSMRSAIPVAAGDTGVYSAAGVGAFRLLVRDRHTYVQWVTARTPHFAAPIGRDSMLIRTDRSVIVFERDATGHVIAVSRSWGGSPPVRFAK
jgi:CubicO group peptidase (beta-lactamase class C family)